MKTDNLTWIFKIAVATIAFIFAYIADKDLTQMDTILKGLPIK